MFHMTQLIHFCARVYRIELPYSKSAILYFTFKISTSVSYFLSDCLGVMGCAA